MSETSEKKLIDLLNGMGGIIEVLRHSSDESSIKLLARVKDKKKWLNILEHVLLNASNIWSGHICQQYFIKDKKMVYGWNIIIQSSDLTSAVLEIEKLIRVSVNKTQQVSSGKSLDSFPLLGYGSYRTSNTVFNPAGPGPGRGGPSQKGAFTVISGE